ncbi:hypothetical protein YC2023_073641 [Brassica napus]
MISREDVQVCSHSKPIEEGVFVKSMEISGVLFLYHNEYMKIKFQILVMCFATVGVKIKLMMQKNYIILFDGYYRWKAKEKQKLCVSWLRFWDRRPRLRFEDESSSTRRE